MRARPVASGALARPAALLLLSFLLGGPAWAAGLVTFNQMIVERCPEKSCEWRLSCGASGPQETELFSGKDARTKYKVNIGRSLDVQQFPASIHCTAWEDDGWFGASWEKVGSSSVDVPAGGDYRLEISNRDQGTVRVLMSVDSLEIAAPAPAAAKPAAPAKKGAPPKPAPAWHYAGAFNPLPGGRAVVIGMEWKPFKELVNKLKGQGLQIDDVETYEQGGKRLWNGIFRNSQEDVILLTDQDWDTFSASWKKLTGGRMRLIDLEVYPSGGKNLFAGIFRDLGEVHAFWVGQKRDEFQAKVKELSENKGQKLLDVEIYRASSGGPPLYAGPFRQSDLETTLWAGMKRADFDHKLQGLRGKELQVVDVETYKDLNQRYYDALVRSGPAGEVVIGLDAAALTAKWRELAAKGLRPVSLEVYQE
jgi:Bacterial tandem repeat domain 1